MNAWPTSARLHCEGRYCPLCGGPDTVSHSSFDCEMFYAPLHAAWLELSLGWGIGRSARYVASAYTCYGELLRRGQLSPEIVNECARSAQLTHV